MTTRLLLVRHGETDGNAAGRAQGRRDVALNATGRRQASARAETLRARPLAAVVASPSTRCVETATAIAAPHGLTVRTDARLQELDQGTLDGLTMEEMRAEAADFLRRWRIEDPTDLRMPGGETLGEAQARMVDACRDVARLFPDTEVAIVSHNLALKALLCHALGVSLAGFRHLQIDLASLSVVDVGPDGVWTVIGINERCRVDAAAPRGDG